MSVDETVSVEFELTPEDWVEVCAAHSLASPLTRKSLTQVRQLFVVICLLLGILQVLSGFGFGALICVIGAAAGYAALPSLLSRAHRSQFRKASREGIANGTFGPHRVELLEEGVLDVTSGYEWLTRWSSIERVEEQSGTFMIYSGANAFLPIPASAFPDSATLRRFGDRFFAHLERVRGLPDEQPSALPAKETPDLDA